MAEIITITDPDDPRIASYRNVRDRDLAGHGAHFMAEGEVVLRVLLTASRLEAVSLLIADNRVGGLSGLLAHTPDGVPVYTAPSAVMDAIAGFHIHRGILALGRRPEPRGATDVLAGLGSRALVVCGIGIANHDNVGGIFRNAAAFGADAVLLDAGSCDPLYRKAIRVSVGGALSVPFAHGGNAEALLDALEAAGFTVFALSPHGAGDIATLRRPARAALLLGAEGPGLPDRVMARATPVRIAMAPGFDSLNVATACGIALHRMFI